MTEMTKKELKIGKKQVEGPLILCWVLAILLGMSLFSGFAWGPFGMAMDYLKEPFTMDAISDFAGGLAGFPFKMFFSLLGPALYIAELIGLYQRKAFAVPLGRAVLVVTMVFFFPVGTIFGGVMWKRFNHPLAKKYLNYEDEFTMEDEEKAEDASRITAEEKSGNK
ncbi:MAG: hypothetical protein JW770_08190 [Actinobacteria bacterium]|nr:hypothetical protein [Actinomycetota bacterium]